MTAALRMAIVGLFFISGFCGLLYEVVWVRLAMANFGITTPVMSVVISVFMLGIALGSYWGGRLIERLASRLALSSLVLYGMSELVIGLSAFTVPKLFSLGEGWLLRFNGMDSWQYLGLSAVVITAAIAPWTFMMGTTFPFMISFQKEREHSRENNFSALYLANVVGGMCGAAMTAALFIELFGFRNTLKIAGGLNFVIAGASFILASRYGLFHAPLAAQAEKPKTTTKQAESRVSPALTGVLLFIGGLSSMGMEVVWTRDFTLLAGTTVYAFAEILVAYLGATWVGSALYRWHTRGSKPVRDGHIVLLLAVTALLPVLLVDPRLTSSAKLAMASIAPFCALLGYFTPKLIDGYSLGDPKRVGLSYGLNTLGCIIGPILASYVLLPYLGIRHSLIVLALPFFLIPVLWFRQELMQRAGRVIAVAALAAIVVAVTVNRSYEENWRNDPTAVIRRDYAATVLSNGSGDSKFLYVNSIAITMLTPVTKTMAHLPLAFHSGTPSSVLIICFGMGSTFRSSLIWGVKTTAVELVPSVKEAFGFYHSDAADIMKDPNGTVVIDDGRRFLKRTDQMFDVVTLDAPPPPETAGESLLFSREFYEDVKSRLKPGGVLQQWFMGGERGIRQATTRAIMDSFPYVRVFRSLDGSGYHFFASMTPITGTAETLASRISPKAAADMIEATSFKDSISYFKSMLAGEYDIKTLLAADPSITITDDRPYNEYYTIRRHLSQNWAEGHDWIK
ncbi:MAG: hypothetical protein HY074_13210 [Deltaproteobacteria bacterium]|nr:hypothetical protein [Deltaproteobacteria bacterium]